MFTFVQALALPSATSRAACLCGSRVRPVRAASSLSPVRVQWTPMRACTPAPADVNAAEGGAEPEGVAAQDPVALDAPPAAAADADVAAAAAPTPVAEADRADAVSSQTKDARTESSNEERREKRKRRRRREVTLPLEKLEVGMELEGTVKSVTSYGAFVGDMGTPTDGLLHVSQLASGFVENVTDVVKVGDKVKVRVTEINLEKSNFSLSMKPVGEEGAGGGRDRASGRSEQKKAAAAKWEVFTFDETVFVDARVSTIADFGAFCQLLDAEGKSLESAPTDGLIHISELSEGRVNNVSDFVSVGQAVKVRVVNVDRKRNRISLSMREYSEGGNDSKESASYAADVKASNSAQPELKSAFELAFERAGIKSKA